MHDLFWLVRLSGAGATFDLSRSLTSIVVEEEDRAPARCTLVVPDPHRVLSHALREGMSIDVDLGTIEEHGPVFSGKIYHVDAGLPQAGVPQLTVKAYDRLMELGLRVRHRRFADQTLSEVVRRIAGEHFGGDIGEIAPLADPPYPGQGLRQREQTDLCFLRGLAEATHCAMGLDREGKFRFVARLTVQQREPPVALAYGRCDVPWRLLTFDAQADAGQIGQARVASGMDPDTGEVLDVRETPVTVTDPEDPLLEEGLAAYAEEDAEGVGALQAVIAAGPTVATELRAALGAARREPIATFATPDQLVQQGAAQATSSLLGMSATGSTVGNKDLHAGDPLLIVGGGRFSGAWFMSKTTHTLDRAGYRTEFTCER